MTAIPSTWCFRCRKAFSSDQLYSEGHNRFVCAPCGAAMKAERSAPAAGPVTITTEHIAAHLPHPVKDAPHLVVCVCGELSYAVPAEKTAMAVWASHLTEVLNVALTGTGGPQ